MNRDLRRRLSYGSNATLVTALVVALVVVLYGVADRHRLRWDLSEGGANRFQPDTTNKIRLLDEAGEPVRITAFSAQSGKKDAWFKNRELKDLLAEIEARSEVIETRFVDFDRERLTAESLGVTMYGTMVIQRGQDRVDIKDRDLFRRQGRKEERQLIFMGEAAISEAFSRLMSDEHRAIYTLTGHGELDMDDSDPGGMSEVDLLLEQEHYDLEELDLLRDREPDENPRIPQDAAAVILARPRTRLGAPEADALSSWLAHGGRLLVLTDVGGAAPRILERLGISRPEGVVSDRRVFYPFPDRPIPVYRHHAITRDLIEGEYHTALALPAPLQTADPPPDGVRYSTLLKTSRSGWIDRGGPMVQGQYVYQPEFDAEGPVDMAIAVKIPPGQGLVMSGVPEARVVAVGDADFMTNALIQEAPGNATFIVNTCRWLVGDDERLSVVGRPTRVRRLALTEEDIGMIRWVALGLMPLVVLLAGAAVWTTRRGR